MTARIIPLRSAADRARIALRGPDYLTPAETRSHAEALVYWGDWREMQIGEQILRALPDAQPQPEPVRWVYAGLIALIALAAFFISYHVARAVGLWMAGVW